MCLQVQMHQLIQIAVSDISICVHGLHEKAPPHFLIAVEIGILLGDGTYLKFSFKAADNPKVFYGLDKPLLRLSLPATMIGVMEKERYSVVLSTLYAG